MADLWLRQLSLRDFRCLSALELPLQPGLNLIQGANGSGKTSILEALSLLLHKRSFRTRRLPGIRRDGQAHALAVVHIERAAQAHRLAVEIGANSTRLRWNSEAQFARTALYQYFPSVIIEPLTALDLLQEPQARRRWLDRSVFHVEHGLAVASQRYQRALSQRNASLQRGGQVLATWTEALVETAAVLTALRETHLPQLEALLKDTIDNIEADVLPPIRLRWRPGHDPKLGLAEHLRQSADSEQRMGYTLAGPHRADIKIEAQGLQARERLSRGQQKLLALCLQLAQLRLLTGDGGGGLLFWDDWQAELSQRTQRNALALVRQSASQALLTTPGGSWPAEVPPPASMFHVEHHPEDQAANP